MTSMLMKEEAGISVSTALELNLDEDLIADMCLQ